MQLLFTVFLMTISEPVTAVTSELFDVPTERMISDHSSYNPAEQERLMDEVENAVQLPPSAEPMNRYARYYGLNETGDIIGIYLLVADTEPAQRDCHVYVDNEPRQIECPVFDWGLKHIKAGERLWVGDQKGLPVIHDGGCSVVHVTYSRTKRSIEEVVCNGFA